jgi:hypothetical protein
MRTGSRQVRGITLDLIKHVHQRMYIARVGDMNLRFFKDGGVWNGQARKNFNGRFNTVRVNRTLDKCVRDILKFIEEETDE